MILRPYYYDDQGCAAYVLRCGTDEMEQILAFNRGHAETKVQA